MRRFLVQVLHTFRCSEDRRLMNPTELLRGFHFHTQTAHTHTYTHVRTHTHTVYYVNTVKTTPPDKQVRRHLSARLIDNRRPTQQTWIVSREIYFSFLPPHPSSPAYFKCAVSWSLNFVFSNLESKKADRAKKDPRQCRMWQFVFHCN